MFEDLFKKAKYITVKEEENSLPMIPNGMWQKCSKCQQILYTEDLKANMMVCPHCGNHNNLSAKDRISLTADENSFEELNSDITSLDPLNFKGYKEKLQSAALKSGLNEAVVTGKCTIKGERCIMAVMDSNFMMGSMGFAVGEKLTLAIEKASEENLPVIIFTASGGARMQEGLISLMQMEKVSAALKKHSNKGLLYISVLTNPTTGGVTASFAMLGDIILAEPGALVGFAGKRVIEGTLKQKLPENFQSSEFLETHGFVDKIVHRKDLKNMLHTLLLLHRGDTNE